MRGLMMDSQLTLEMVLRRTGSLYRGREIVSRLADRSLHRYSYGDMHRRARALARALQLAGIKPGDRVASLMWNHYGHLEAYFGVPCSGAVLHTLNLRLHPSELAFIANHAGDRFLIVDDVLLPMYEAIREQTHFERVFVFRHCEQNTPGGYELYEDFLASSDGKYVPAVSDENQAAALCYTSGTTGESKGVLYSHRALVLHAMAACLPDSFGISANDVFAPMQPMFHANAWGYPIIAAMLGCKQVFHGPHLDCESVLDLFTAEKATFSGGVPTLWLALVETLDRFPGRWKLQPMRAMVAGTACPESLTRALDRHNIRALHAWGMTETTPLATIATLGPEFANATDDERYAARARHGIPVPAIECRIVNEHGEAPWDGQAVGELEVRGPWVASAYFDNAQASAVRWTSDGWLRTGDVACIDPLGSVKLVDRSKDLIKSGGEWISSVDLENAIMAHPAVKEAAVVGVLHAKWQERPMAIVVLKLGEAACAESINEFLLTRFAKWQLPDSYQFVNELPRTSTGKVSKATLREQYKALRIGTAAE